MSTSVGILLKGVKKLAEVSGGGLITVNKGLSFRGDLGSGLRTVVVVASHLWPWEMNPHRLREGVHMFGFQKILWFLCLSARLC